jgi:hypothetical protein
LPVEEQPQHRIRRTEIAHRSGRRKGRLPRMRRS